MMTASRITLNLSSLHQLPHNAESSEEAELTAPRAVSDSSGGSPATDSAPAESGSENCSDEEIPADAVPVQTFSCAGVAEAFEAVGAGASLLLADERRRGVPSSVASCCAGGTLAEQPGDFESPSALTANASREDDEFALAEAACGSNGCGPCSPRAEKDCCVSSPTEGDSEASSAPRCFFRIEGAPFGQVRVTADFEANDLGSLRVRTPGRSLPSSMAERLRSLAFRSLLQSRGCLYPLCTALLRFDDGTQVRAPLGGALGLTGEGSISYSDGSSYAGSVRAFNYRRLGPPFVALKRRARMRRLGLSSFAFSNSCSGDSATARARFGQPTGEDGVFSSRDFVALH